jgi:hypothetical protein
MLIISFLALFFSTPIFANQCVDFLVLEQGNQDSNDSSMADAPLSVFDNKYSKHLDLTQTVMALITRFSLGQGIKIDDMFFVVKKLLERNVLTSYEARGGADISKVLYENFDFREEYIYKALVRFHLRLFDLQGKDSAAHLLSARRYILDYNRYYPESKYAKSLLNEVIRRME